MYCIKCGKQLNDKSVFCSACGERVKPAEKYSWIKSWFVGQMSVTKMSKNIWLIGVILMLSIVIFGGRKLFMPAYEKPVHYFINACVTEKYKGFERAFPVDYMNSEMRDEMQDYYDDIVLSMKNDSGLQIKKNSAKIVDKEEISQEELNDREQLLYYWYGLEKMEITGGYTLDIEYTVILDGEREIESMEVDVIEIDGKWYLDISNW